MKKSVYSLVLMDDVVDAIDKLAYSMNTSRSNLINQILAEKVSYILYIKIPLWQAVQQPSQVVEYL